MFDICFLDNLLFFKIKRIQENIFSKQKYVFYLIYTVKSKLFYVVPVIRLHKNIRSLQKLNIKHNNYFREKKRVKKKNKRRRDV